MTLWLFWAIAAALTGMVVVTLIQALRRGTDTVAEHPDLKVYRDQLAEIDRDLARGALAADEAQRLRVEVSRRLLDADRAERNAPQAAHRGSLYWAGGVVAVVLTGSLWLYQTLGAAGYADLPLQTRLAMAEEAYATRPSQAEAEAATPAPPTPAPDAEFLSLMDKLRAAVAARPDDVQGLELLARNEAALGNYPAALDAQRKLLAKLSDAASPDQRYMEAQIMVAAAGGYVSPEAEAVLLEVLARDPEHGMSRYFSGLMFAQVGRPDRAFQLWEPLLRAGPADAPWMAPIGADIQTVADQAGIKYTAPTAPDSKGPTVADVEAAEEMSVEDRQAMIAGMVDQLEVRLLSENGPLEDWLKLINALAVLNQPERGKSVLAAAQTALAGDEAALQAVKEAAAAAGFGP